MLQIKKPTEEQQKIINNNSNVVVTAMPGSGKTFTIVEKIHQITQALYNYQGVIAISFTRKASRELEMRSKRKGTVLNQSFYGTIDSFYISQIIIPFAKHLTKKIVQLDVKTTVKSFPEYEKLIAIKNGVDSDLEALLISSLSQGYIFLDLCGETAFYILEHVKEAKEYLVARYTHIFIDEYQDCGDIQHKIFMFLVDAGITGIAVGDINQAIFAFTNRYPKYLLSLLANPKFTPYEITKNHRCHKSISNYSLRLLGMDIPPYVEKRIFKVSLSGDEENIAKFIGTRLPAIMKKYDVELNNQVAILCRSNTTSKRISSNLSLPFKVFENTDLDNANSYWAGFFNDFLQSYYDPNVFNVDFTDRYFNEESDNNNYRKALKIIDGLFCVHENDLHFHIKEIVSLAKMAYPEYERTDIVDILSDILHSDEKLKSYAPAKSEEINILSLHKSKGLEYDIVFHLDLYEYVMPPYKGTQEDYDQALNLHYVGITRAKKACFIMEGSMRHNAKSELKPANESEFLGIKSLKNYRNDLRWKETKI